MEITRQHDVVVDLPLAARIFSFLWNFPMVFSSLCTWRILAGMWTQTFLHTHTLSQMLQVNRKTSNRTMEELGRRTLEKEEEEFYTFRTCWEKEQRRESKNSVIFFHTHSVPIIREFKDKNAIASVALITWFCQLAYNYKMKMHKTQSLGLVFKFQALLQLPSFKFAPASILFVTPKCVIAISR